jgi:hypothetical protein
MDGKIAHIELFASVEYRYRLLLKCTGNEIRLLVTSKSLRFCWCYVMTIICQRVSLHKEHVMLSERMSLSTSMSLRNYYIARLRPIASDPFKFGLEPSIAAPM